MEVPVHVKGELMRKIVPIVALAGATVFAACDSLGQAMTAHTDVVARAAGYELKVDEVARLLATNPRLPAQAEVVDAVANLWIDYILMATASARDSMLTGIDLDAIVRPHVDQEMVWKLRDRVIQVDTILGEGELQELYERERPGLQVRARHILLRVPADATPTQRDSLLALADDLKTRARAGQDFAQLARDYSQDPAAQNGGDLGFFGRGQMVGPFEEAAFQLEPGQISEVVETPFGFHIIKLEERRLPPFDEVQDAFRQELVFQRQIDAEEAYVRGLTDPLNITVEDGAFEVARQLAFQPHMRLSRRAASRPLVNYRGGAFTASEFLALIRRSTPRERAGVMGAGDEQLEQMLRGLAQNEILVGEARRLGLEVTPAERDSIYEVAREQLRIASGQAGLRNIQPTEGETLNEAIERRVNTLIEGIVRGDRQVFPLGPIAFTLRDRYDAQLFDRSFTVVLSRLEAMRPPEQQVPETFFQGPDGRPPVATPAQPRDPQQPPQP
jgi:hypothetical protein